MNNFIRPLLKKLQKKGIGQGSEWKSRRAERERLACSRGHLQVEDCKICYFVREKGRDLHLLALF